MQRYSASASGVVAKQCSLSECDRSRFDSGHNNGGDFCRRFRQSDIDDLLLAINETRLNLWKQQEASFFERAIIDVYGVIVATKGEHLSDQENLIAQLSGGVRSLCAPVDNLLSNWA